MSNFSPSQTLLLILDGWGQAVPSAGNAVSLASTPAIDALMASRPKAFLTCSGRAVGLPEGFMGNSEVGHMNIGAGRVVYQDMTRIDLDIENRSFYENPVICGLLEKTKKSDGTVHFMGLLSDGGVHSHIQHLFELVKLAHQHDVPSLIHVFTDGRDTSPDSGEAFIAQLLDILPSSSLIATISGRYYAMDRDKRWDRTNKAWQTIVHAAGLSAPDALTCIRESYAQSVSDEFILPTVIGDFNGIQPNDSVFMFNFRADRMRQLAHCFNNDPTGNGGYIPCPPLSAIASMTTYEETLPFPVAFAPQAIHNGMGETVARAGLAQLRIAETEKYAHVTFFFNGGKEEPEANEDRILIPSPRDVATYDLKPEMSAVEVTDALIREWETGKYTFTVCNLANMDMVGHTGNIPAAIKACETVDACVARIVDAVRRSHGLLMVTADHGNAEEMLTPQNSLQTAHSKNLVAFIIDDSRPQRQNYSVVSSGKLCDIAPTILTLWGLPLPAEMTGKPLVTIHE